jgi:type IV pilus assembly protein PilA
MREEGFTMPEVLIVMVIVGALSAIALPAFRGHENKGRDSEAKSDARNLVSHVQSCYAETDDYTACDSASELGTTGLDIDPGGFLPSLPGDGKVKVTNSTSSTFVVVANSKSSNYFAITRGVLAGTVFRSCGTVMTVLGIGSGSATGGCRSGNTW